MLIATSNDGDPFGGSGPPVPEDPDIAVPQRAPPHEPPIPVKDPVEPDKPQDNPIKV